MFSFRRRGSSWELILSGCFCMPALSFHSGDRWDGAGDEQAQSGRDRSLAIVVTKWYPHQQVLLSSTYRHWVRNRPGSDNGSNRTYFGRHSSRLHGVNMQVNFRPIAWPLNENRFFFQNFTHCFFVKWNFHPGEWENRTAFIFPLITVAHPKLVIYSSFIGKFLLKVWVPFHA